MAELILRDDRVIPEAELEVAFARSSGPGGQNVNKVNTKVEVRFRLGTTQCLSPSQRQRLARAFPSHATRDGDFIVVSDRFRSQSLNQQDALQRLREMILSVWFPPKKRLATKPSKAAKLRRVTQKRKVGDRKRERTRRDFE